MKVLNRSAAKIAAEAIADGIKAWYILAAQQEKLYDLGGDLEEMARALVGGPDSRPGDDHQKEQSGVLQAIAEKLYDEGDKCADEWNNAQARERG